MVLKGCYMRPSWVLLGCYREVQKYYRGGIGVLLGVKGQILGCYTSFKQLLQGW